MSIVTDAIAQAWAANDAALAGLVAEMNTLADEVNSLTGTGDQGADVVAAIQQRTAAMQAALQSVQSSLGSASTGDPGTPATTVSSGQATDVPTPDSPISTPLPGTDSSGQVPIAPSPDPSTTVDSQLLDVAPDTAMGDADQTSGGGSPMG